MLQWHLILLSQCPFLERECCHFKKDHHPWAQQKSVGFEAGAAVNLVAVASLSHIHLPCLVSGVVDAIDGVTKTKLTAASAKKLLDPEDGMDVKKLDASTMRENKKFPFAGECAWWSEREGCEGAKPM